jgi:apolipoprotein N-acyltransferase
VWEGGAKAADLLVNLSNDGWFGWYDAGRLQHQQAARLRAIENRVPLVRVANTGASAAIDSCGRITAVAGGAEAPRRGYARRPRDALQQGR